MGDGSLTQDEIDLLLQGTGDAAASSGPVAAGGVAGMGLGGGEEMSPLEREAVGDIIHNALQSGTQGLGLILSRNVKLGAPYVEIRSQADAERELGNEHVGFSQQCSGSLNGTLGLFIPSEARDDISAIVT